MESMELRVFLEVAYTGSITKAAENMGYVQSNITAHIKKLEIELHTTLFIRSYTGVSLTQDGEKLLPQAEKIIDMIDITTQSFSIQKESLSIGTTQTIASSILPPCLAKYQEQFPSADITIHTLQQDAFEQQLKEGNIDCVITNRSREIAQAKLLYEWKEELLLLVPSTCKSLNELEQYPMIINHIATCPYRNTLLKWWNKHHAKGARILELDTVDAILNMIALDQGFTLLPKQVLQHKENIHSFFIEELQTTAIHIWVANNKQPSMYSAFLELIINEIKKDSLSESNENSSLG